MRFMVLLKANADSEAGVLPDETLLAAMGKYNQALVDAGVLVDAAGLQSSAKGARVRFSGARRTVVDGPFPETKELVAGYWVFQVASREEAIEWVKRCPNPLDGDAEIEIRQVFEVEDFPNVPDDVRAMEQKLHPGHANSLRVNPYLTFDGSCAEAFRFYAKTLGARIEMMMTHGESPVADQHPESRDRIMHARLAIGDTVLMGSDRPPQWKEPVSGFSVSLAVDRPADAERIFAALSEGGQVRLPLQETFFAARFGMLVDRFGIPWMINCEKAA